MTDKNKSPFKLKLSIDKDLFLKGEIINLSNKTRSYLYDHIEKYSNYPELNIIQENGEKINLTKIILGKMKLKERDYPAPFTELKPGESSVLFSKQFVEVGKFYSDFEPQYKSAKILNKKRYEIFLGLATILSGINPGKYKIYIKWRSNTKTSYNHKTREETVKKNTWIGNLKSNIITVNLPEFK